MPFIRAVFIDAILHNYFSKEITLMELNFTEIEKLVKEQEETLVFDHFSNKDAWELGQFMVKKVYEKGIDLAICIKKRNGNVIFQYMTEKANLLNEYWMERKFKTVNLLERSSFGSWAEYNVKERELADDRLSENEYALCGGGFPIRLKSGEMVGVLLTSNLPHEQDHDFMIECLKEWLGCPNVPNIKF